MDESFESYVGRSLPALLRLAGGLSGDRGTAEDVVQEVLLRASGRWTQIVATGAVHAYVRRMVVNEYLSWHRKWSRLVPYSEVPDARQAPDHADRHAERDALADQLDRLPPKQRAAVVLRYYEALGDAAIAEVLGCGEATVRSHVSRGLAALRVDERTRACAVQKEI